MPELHEVFGIATQVNRLSYVDRGGLDERFAYLLRAQRHIAVHGDSKIGKSWLRASALKPEESIRLQCQVDTTPETLFREALGQLGIRAELKRTAGDDFEGVLDATASGEVGMPLLAKAKAQFEAKGTAVHTARTETTPVGQSPADLSWVAAILLASGKRLVIEDFHYISEEHQRRFAYMLKAIGEYGVFPVIVGIWPQDNLLTYYNGDLEGRVEDIRLSWKDEELEQVLLKGADALNLDFDQNLRRQLVQDAYGNVGLLQRLAEQLCIQEGIRRDQSERRRVGGGGSLDGARAEVAKKMEPRFRAFADNFVRGMRRLSEGLEVYRYLLASFTSAPDEELITGIDSAVLLGRIEKLQPSIRQSDLTQALERVDRLQVKIQVNPLVLTYSKGGRRVFLADRSLLFFRKYGKPDWPWSGSNDLTNDLAKTEPLQID